MGRSQQVAVLPLHVVDDAAPVQAAMQTDGDETRLARHEAARSVITLSASACFSGSDSTIVICVSGCLLVWICGMEGLISLN